MNEDSFTFGLFAPDLYNQAFVVVFLSIPKSFLEKVVEEVEKDLLFSMKSFVKSVKRVDHNTAVFYLPRPASLWSGSLAF